LAHFGASRADNPGRLQLYRFGGVTAFVDYAHNPDGIAALCRTAASMPATRRLLILGQAGNRPDESLRDLAQSAWAITPFDRVILKDIPRMLRGRQPGDVSRILGEALLQAGAGSDQIDSAPSEFDAVQRAFAWARDGDLLLLPVHAERELVLPWLARLHETEWRAGMPLLPLA
jgi:UDP-N-acetylmuramyl tripeptide synthase